METPPKPSFSKDKDQTMAHRNLERTAKTPFQSSFMQQRSFRSELQPKMSNRFYNETIVSNAKSSTRFYPSTSQRQIIRPKEETKTSVNETKSYIVSRLANIVKSNKEMVNPVKKVDRVEESAKPNVLNVLSQAFQPSSSQPTVATTTSTAATTAKKPQQHFTPYQHLTTQSKTNQQIPQTLYKPSLLHQPTKLPPYASVQQSRQVQPITKQLEHKTPKVKVQSQPLPLGPIIQQQQDQRIPLLNQPIQPTPLQQLQHQHQQQQQQQQPLPVTKLNDLHQMSQHKVEIQSISHHSQYNTKPQLNLIQDTRGTNQQVGPTTVTKAPLSVSQYTQPTPGTKSAYKMSRAQSEPSIKYQIQVNDKTYKILRKIGSGGSAKVYEAFEPKTSQTVAIKIINIAQADARTQESYFNEKSLLTQLRDSKHVVRMYDSEYKSECKELVIIMEKGDADLSQVIDSYFKTRDRTIDGIFIKYYWRGMVQAVNDIHLHGIVHADLKPVNFILVKNEIKLIDFGIANAVDPESTSIIRDYQIGTINYMAPEALRNRALDASFQHLIVDVDENNPQNNKKTVIKYNTKVDIWSLGCILYNLVYGKPPFDNYKDILSKVQAITNPNHKIDFPEISNQNLLNCIRSCLKYNPADRPTAQELLRDPYLKEDIVMIQRI